MSAVIDLIRPNGLVLLNESFASTNEREGAEIAREVVSALLESGVKDFLRHAHVRIRPPCSRAASTERSVPTGGEACGRHSDLQGQGGRARGDELRSRSIQ
jgi:hypothetical protein